MVTSFIFFAHLFFALTIFTKKWQYESLAGAFSNMALIGILFSVGWTITTVIAKSIMSTKGFGIYFDRDAFSLSLLTISEFFFYKMYYHDLFAKTDISEAQKEESV
jgi:uncharacterized membrane protein YhdT